jgi:hypothetical protein
MILIYYASLWLGFIFYISVLFALLILLFLLYSLEAKFKLNCHICGNCKHTSLNYLCTTNGCWPVLLFLFGWHEFSCDIISIFAILYLSINLFWILQLGNDGDFVYLLADAAAIAVCSVSIFLTLLSIRQGSCVENLYHLQFQYGNPDVLCSPLVEAKKNGTDLVVSSTFILKNNVYSCLWLGAVVKSSPLVPRGPGFEPASLHCTLQQ